MRLLSVAGDRVIDLFPDAEETAVVTAEEPAFFRLEAAAEGAVGNKLVDCCISVRSRQVVFFHKAVSSECFIKEGDSERCCSNSSWNRERYDDR